MIVLKQTATELLLYVPYDQRNRAKKIEGRTWDPRRRCWIYRRTRRALEEILLEFADELDPSSSDLRGLSVDGDGKTASKTPQVDVREPKPLPPADALRGLAAAESDGALERLREELNTEIVRKDDELAHASERIRSFENQLASLTRERGAVAASVARGEEELARRQKRISELESRVAQLERSPAIAAGLESGVREVVRALFPVERELDSIVRSVLRSDDFPIALARKLEADLRAALRDTEPTPFVDLIRKSGEADILSQEALDLAHLLRKQRNRLLHPTAPIVSLPTSTPVRIARNFLAISAMRMLVGELGKRSPTGHPETHTSETGE